MTCWDVATYGSLALDGSLTTQATLELGGHLESCVDCTRYIDQMAKTRALLGGREPARGDRGNRRSAAYPGTDRQEAEPDEPEEALLLLHGYLMTLARAIDPSHADDLVQDAWNHFLGDDSTKIPSRDQLTTYLLTQAQTHVHDDEATAEAWADTLSRHHPHNPADLAGTDLPADPSQHEDWRTLADLDSLDADADRAELYFPELYGDGPDKGEWSAPPAAWPSVTRMLSPEEELQTSELYSLVDAALDELPGPIADAVYLVDIEGQSLDTAVVLLGRDATALKRDLVRARNHVRGRVGEYLASR